MNGDEALFEATAREVLERDDVPALRLDLADHLAKSSRFGEARTHYDAVAAGGAGPPRASSRYARALAGAGDAAAAQGVLLQALQHHPASAELHYDQGVLMSSQGRFDLAEQSFRQALELSPSHLPARVNLAGVLCETGRFREGIVEFEKVLAADPQDDETHVLLARAHAQLGDTGAAHIHLQQAAAILERRLAGDARDAQRRVRLFNVCLMLQDWDRAAEQLQLVVQQHPELADQIAPLQQQLDAARREPDRSGAEP
jgi:tetratricopeptide (TPR) repeat protein